VILSLENGALAKAGVPRPRRRGGPWLAGLVSLTAHLMLGAALFLRLPSAAPAAPGPPMIFVSLAAPVSPPRPERETPKTAPKPQPREPRALAPSPPIRPRPLPFPAPETFAVVPPRPEARPAAQQGAPPTLTAPPAPRVASNAPDSWQGRVLAHLDKHRRYPASALIRRQQGVVYVRFTVDRQGKVLSARLEASSGFPMLDREAVSLPKRATPLPKPPETVPGEIIELVVPVEFAVP
jgi:protein TonB